MAAIIMYDKLPTDPRVSSDDKRESLARILFGNSYNLHKKVISKLSQTYTFLEKFRRSKYLFEICDINRSKRKIFNRTCKTSQKLWRFKNCRIHRSVSRSCRRVSKCISGVEDESSSWKRSWEVKASKVLISNKTFLIEFILVWGFDRAHMLECKSEHQFTAIFPSLSWKLAESKNSIFIFRTVKKRFTPHSSELFIESRVFKSNFFESSIIWHRNMFLHHYIFPYLWDM